MNVRKAIGLTALLTLLSAGGQAQASAILDSFTFYIDGAATLDFQAQVYAWSGSLTGGNPPQGATGPALFTSAVLTYTDTDGPGVFTAITINTGGLFLPDGNYVALLTTSGLQTDPNVSGTTGWGDTQFVHVANSGGGGFNFYNNGDNRAALNTTPWDDSIDFGDLAWTAVFNGGGFSFNTVPSWDGSSFISEWGIPETATYGQTFTIAQVPEPTSLALLAAGALAFMGMGFRRPRRKADDLNA
jgi:hypothetical protein